MNELPVPLRAATVLAWVVAFGTLLLAIAHTGVTIPLLSALGPDGDSAVPPAVVAFTVATILFAAIALGLARQSKVAWWGGIGLSAAIILSSIGQFRGAVSALGIVLAVLLIALLLSPPSRQAVSA